MLVSDTAGELIDGNDLWYRGPVSPTSHSKPLVEKLLAAKHLEPSVLVIDDTAMNRDSIDYLGAIVKHNRHTKITIIMLFQAFTREVSPSIRNNARLMYFATAAGRPLLELIYDAIPTTHTKKEFIVAVSSKVEKYRFVYVNRESGELYYFKPDIAKAKAFVYVDH